MISIKKVATLSAAAGMLAMSAMPAFAGFWFSNDELVIKQKNSGAVKNYIDTHVNTGKNSSGNETISTFGFGRFGGWGGHQSSSTGDAAAVVEVNTGLNSNVAAVDACGCFDDVTIRQKNRGYVKNDIDTWVNTGKNSTGGNTGDALAGISVTTVVNDNVAIVGSGTE